MAWELYIKTFDVGRGESSVIVADEPVAAQRRTMLIDGGLANQGANVNTYLDNYIGVGAEVNHIVVTHYDVDHSGGIMSMLGADNFYAICDKIAEVTATQVNGGVDRPQSIAGGACAACAAILGAYDVAGGGNYAAQANVYAFSARTIVGIGSGLTDDAAAAIGVKEAISNEKTYGPLNAMLMPFKAAKKRRQVSTEAAIAGYNAAIGGQNVRDAVRTAVFNELQTMVNDNYHFITNGRFAETHIIDTGNAYGLPNGYTNLVAGRIMMTNTWIQAPAINRTRTTPNLGAEVLWNSGPIAMLAPANSPMVYVMARNAYVWKAPNNQVPLAQALDNNNDSYGLILRFNNFVFYTGGDLISAGEDLIADAVMANGLPDPNGGIGATFPVPHRIAAFKVGHHGADTCTSQHFLNTGLQKVGIISCGAMYGHPFQSVIDELHNCATINFFYLTACAYLRNFVPASFNPAGNQLTTVGNKSRVAGGIAVPPGHIALYLNEAESSSTSVAIPLNIGDTALRQFHVQYYDYDKAGGPGLRTENTIF